MRFVPTAIPDVILVEPDVYKDDRGFFLETYHEKKYAAGGIPGPFVQDNHSRSVQGTLRGLHAQIRHPQGKLVRAVEGEMFDVAVDIRRQSPTFGRWVGVRLSGENFRQLYVPPGFAHGFCVVSAQVHVEYKCTAFYDPADEISIAWDDPEIGIQWPMKDPIVVGQGQAGPTAQRDGRSTTLAGRRRPLDWRGIWLSEDWCLRSRSSPGVGERRRGRRRRSYLRPGPDETGSVLAGVTVDLHGAGRSADPTATTAQQRPLRVRSIDPGRYEVALPSAELRHRGAGGRGRGRPHGERRDHSARRS